MEGFLFRLCFHVLTWMLSMHQNKIRGWSNQEGGSLDVVPKSWHLYNLLNFLSGYVSLFVNNWESINFRIATFRSILSLIKIFEIRKSQHILIPVTVVCGISFLQLKVLLVSKWLRKQLTGGKKSKQSGRRYVRRGSPEWWAFSRWQQIRSSGIWERPTNGFQQSLPLSNSLCLRTLELSCKEHCRGYPKFPKKQNLSQRSLPHWCPDNFATLLYSQILSL